MRLKEFSGQTRKENNKCLGRYDHFRYHLATGFHFKYSVFQVQVVDTQNLGNKTSFYSTNLSITLLSPNRVVFYLFLLDLISLNVQLNLFIVVPKKFRPIFAIFPIPRPASILESHPISHENPGNGLENGKFPAQGNHGTTLLCTLLSKKR